MTTEFVDELRDLMPHSIIVEPFLGRDRFGAPTYGAAVTYQGRVANKTRNVIGADGQQVVSSGDVVLATITTVSVDDRVTLPGGKQPVLLASNMNADETGDAFVTLYFQ